MKLIEALKRLAAIHLKGEISYERRTAFLYYDAFNSDGFNLHTSLATDNTFPHIGRNEVAVIAQALVDDPEALELFIVSELQRVLGSILELNDGAGQFPFQYWAGWLSVYHVEAETLRKDMNL